MKASRQTSPTACAHWASVMFSSRNPAIRQRSRAVPANRTWCLGHAGRAPGNDALESLRAACERETEQLFQGREQDCFTAEHPCEPPNERVMSSGVTPDQCRAGSALIVTSAC